MADEPIDEQNYLYGPKVVDIGDIRVSRGETRRPRSICRHSTLSYDLNERRVWCRDCESDVDSFDAFIGLVSQHDTATKRLNRLKDEALSIEKANIRRIAAKNLETEWNRKHTIPCCPHCDTGLLADDFKQTKCVSKEIELAKRSKKSRT